MQALMLAAGMGKRLGRYTNNNTKCMLKVHGKTLIERACEALLEVGIKRFVIVIGYKGENLKHFLLEECSNPKIKEMEFIFINNDVYNKTNNIYSLYLAKDEMIKDNTILLESDLIYDNQLIKMLVDAKDKNLVSVAKYQQWMDGTVIRVGEKNSIVEFIEKKNFKFSDTDDYYKTVNIYKFEKQFLKNVFVPFLESYIKAYGENEYYELVLKIIAHLSRSDLKALDVSEVNWYEIDDAQDLDIATCIFSEGEAKLKNFQKRYGGYWRFESKLLDYCYLVNPYYPTQKMLDQINYFSKELITQYPSGQNIECINAGRLFNGTLEYYLCVGNGAAELISALGRILKGKMYATKSAFNEYHRCFKNCEFVLYDMSQTDYKYDLSDIKQNIKDCNIICIVNPDNPTGSFIKKEQMLDLLKKAKQNNTIVIFDESFIDFARDDIRYSFINNEILSEYNNLIVVKSISKSYGVPGIRLGVLATSNMDIMKKLKEEIAIWNINSYGEYFLQIANLYSKDYQIACSKIVEEREYFKNKLERIKGLKVYDSEANYLFCYLENFDSTELAIKLLNKNIFIKDLKTKKAFEGQNYIRLAVRTREENDRLVSSLKDIISREATK